MSGHVFVSYSHGHDGSYVERLATHLNSTGAVTWFDREIITGDRWEEVIRHKIDTCAAFIVVMTPQAEASRWVKREITRAEEMGKPIFPLLLAGEKFFRLNDVQYEDVRSGGLPASQFLDRLRDLASPPSNHETGAAGVGTGPRVSSTGPPVAAEAVTTIPTSNAVVSLAFSHDGRSLAVATGTNTVRVFDTGSWRQRFSVRQLWHGNASVYAVAFSPVLDELATGVSIAGGGMVQLWDSTGNRRRKIAHDAIVRAVAFDPDGAWLATGDGNGKVQIWNALRGKPLIQVSHSDDVQGVAFSPDKRWLATASSDRTARIWDVHTGDRKAVLAHDYGVRAVAFSPDSRRLATASMPAQIWDADSGTKILSLWREPDSTPAICHDIAFGPDGRLVAAAYGDHIARVWDARTGAELLKLTHDHVVHAAAFSPDGRLLVTGDGDLKFVSGAGIGTVTVWQLTP